MEAIVKAKSPSSSRAGLKWIATGILVLLVTAYLGVGAYVANELSVPKRQFSVAGSPIASSNVAFQDIGFPARGGDVQIAGWYLPNAASTRALVLVHGKDASRTEEFDHQFVNLATVLQARGYQVLMIDLRGHGASSAARFSFGLNERRDVEGAVDWLVSKGIQTGRIGVLGVSLGAASAIGASADDARIGALVTDSAFADWCPVMQRNWNSATGLPDALLPSVLLMNRAMNGYDLCDSQPVKEIGKIAPRPVLLIHSTDDQMVPVSNAYALKSAGLSAQTWIVSGPEHARIYNADPAEYVRRVSEFFNAGLGK